MVFFCSLQKISHNCSWFIVHMKVSSHATPAYLCQGCMCPKMSPKSYSDITFAFLSSVPLAMLTLNYGNKEGKTKTMLSISHHPHAPRQLWESVRVRRNVQPLSRTWDEPIIAYYFALRKVHFHRTLTTKRCFQKRNYYHRKICCLCTGTDCHK